MPITMKNTILSFITLSFFNVSSSHAEEGDSAVMAKVEMSPAKDAVALFDGETLVMFGSFQKKVTRTLS